MVTKQGSLDLLNDPVAQNLLHSSLPARLAYVWTDGTPRVVPIWFHWNGQEIVVCGPAAAPKMHVLHDGTKVALVIDTDTMPYKTLSIRGSVHVEQVDGVPLEYVDAGQRALGEQEGKAFAENIGTMITPMARIVIQPEWVGILDFEHRFPNAVERAMERAQAESRA